ncbi:hypothetical protein EV359DRAFT_66356 [Lentinula novae-zelandiae]|nr:hypothetical protein EV359DRAFT_66356 [Lentinula novae-zelandiae]
MSPSTLAPQNIAQSAIGLDSTGPLLIAGLVHWSLLGTFLIQLFTNWGVVSIMTSTPWSATLAALTTATCMLYQSQRQPQLCKSSLLVFAIMYFLFNDDYIKIVKLDPIAEIWLSAAAAGDWIIGVTFVAILQQQKRKSPFITTQHLLDKVIVNVVESGLITATLALLDLILFKTLPTTTAHVTVEFALGSLYANVLMANLNSREKLIDSTRKGLERSQSFGLNPLQSTHMSTIGHIGDVHISTEVVQHDDHSGFHMIVGIASSQQCSELIVILEGS